MRFLRLKAMLGCYHQNTASRLYFSFFAVEIHPHASESNEIHNWPRTHSNYVLEFIVFYYNNLMAYLSFCIFFRWQLYLSILSSFLLGELSYFSYLLSNHYILSSTFSYNKLNYSITNLFKFYLYSWKCNQLIFDLEPIQATYTYSSLLYMTASLSLCICLDGNFEC